MGNFSMIVGTICLTIIDIISLAMVIRAIMSLFSDEENMFSRILYAITEPVVAPVRKLFEKLNFLSDRPLDMSFMVTYLVLILIRELLGMWF